MGGEWALLKLSYSLTSTSGISMHTICYEKTFKNILLSDISIFFHIFVRNNEAMKQPLYIWPTQELLNLDHNNQLQRWMKLLLLEAGFRSTKTGRSWPSLTGFFSVCRILEKPSNYHVSCVLWNWKILCLVAGNFLPGKYLMIHIWLSSIIVKVR